MWIKPSNKEKVGKKIGNKWTIIEHKNSHKEYMQIMEEKFHKFEAHDRQILWSKKQMHKLKKHLPNYY